MGNNQPNKPNCSGQRDEDGNGESYYCNKYRSVSARISAQRSCTIVAKIEYVNAASHKKEQRESKGGASGRYPHVFP